MKYAAPWALGLALLSVTLLQPPCAWGQVRTHSGALTRQSGIEHPKELERRIFQLTNEARRKNGLPALEPDDDADDPGAGKKRRHGQAPLLQPHQS